MMRVSPPGAYSPPASRVRTRMQQIVPGPGGAKGRGILVLDFGEVPDDNRGGFVPVRLTWAVGANTVERFSNQE